MKKFTICMVVVALVCFLDGAWFSAQGSDLHKGFLVADAGVVQTVGNADGNEAEAKALRKKGAQLLREGKQAEALTVYKKSLELQHDPNIEAFVKKLEGMVGKKKAQPAPATGEIPKPASGNLLKNGSFELGPANVGDWKKMSVGSRDLTGWEITKGSIDVNEEYWSNSQGKRSLDMNGTNAGSIRQTFKTTPKQGYTLQFQMAGNNYCGSKIQKLRVTVAGTEKTFSFDNTGKTRPKMGWEGRQLGFVATGDTTSLEFESLENGVCGSTLDDVIVASQSQSAPVTQKPLPGNLPESVSEDCFTDNGDGTITDKCTKLMWAKKDSQDGTGSRLEWNKLKEYVSRLKTGGHSDWRMPTVKELKSLIHDEFSNKSSNGETILISPKFASGGSYWAWSSEEDGAGWVRTVRMDDGNVGEYRRNYSYGDGFGVRAVRP